MWHHKLHKGGALGAKTLADIGSGASMGIAALSQDLTINSITVSPTFRYEAKNATTGLWTATVGENLTGAGSGGTVGLDTPLLTDDEAVNGDGTRRWEGPDTSFADVTTQDIVIDGVFKPLIADNGRLITKRTGFAEGYSIYYSSASQIAVSIEDALSATTTISSAADSCPVGAWSYFLAVLDRSGSAQIHVNGQASGSAVSIASIGSISVSALLTLFSRAGGATPFTGEIAYLSMWQRDAWLDTHLQASVAAERFAKLNGTWSSALSKGPDQSLLRNSVATLEKQGQSGGQKLFTVGARWPRIEKRPDKYGRYSTGYNSEGQHTNLLPYSEKLDDAAWFKLRLSVTPNAYAGPNGEQTADVLVEDGTASATRYISDGIGSAAGTYTHFAIAKAINRQWIRLSYFSTTDGSAAADFNLADGIVGTQNNNDSAGIRYLGDGYYLCWMTDTRATAEAQTAYISLLAGDNTPTFSGLSQDSVIIACAQVTATAYPVSYIKTEGATVTRLGDTCRYASLSLPTSGTLACDTMVPAGVSGKHLVNLSTGGTNRVSFYLISANRSALAVVSSGVVGALISGTSGFTGDAWGESRGTFKTDDARIYENGTEVSSDASVDEPVSLTQIDVGGYISAGFELNGLVRLRLLSKPTDKNVTDFGAIMAKSSAYVSTPAAVAQSTSYANVGGTFTEVNSSDFTVTAAGVFTYTGTDTKRFACFAACSGTVSSGTPEVSTAWEKNGTEVASSVSKRDVSGSGIGAWGVTADIELANGDTLNLATKVDSGTPNLTLEACSVVIVEAGN